MGRNNVRKERGEGKKLGGGKGGNQTTPRTVKGWSEVGERRTLKRKGKKERPATPPGKGAKPSPTRIRKRGKGQTKSSLQKTEKKQSQLSRRKKVGEGGGG